MLLHTLSYEPADSGLVPFFCASDPPLHRPLLSFLGGCPLPLVPWWVYGLLSVFQQLPKCMFGILLTPPTVSRPRAASVTPGDAAGLGPPLWMGSWETVRAGLGWGALKRSGPLPGLGRRLPLILQDPPGGCTRLLWAPVLVFLHRHTQLRAGET